MSPHDKHLLSRSHCLSDDKLMAAIHPRFRTSAEEARHKIAAVRRYIDFDLTLTTGTGARWHFLGRSLANFLMERPFIIQSQTGDLSDITKFFDRHPILPWPILIIRPPWLGVSAKELWFDPTQVDPEFSGSHWIWKNLHAIGVPPGSEVYDDFGIDGVFAPDCQVISRFD